MEIRRLVKSGKTSHTVSLPKTWIDKNNLDKGSLVYVKESNNELILSTADKVDLDKKEIVLNIENKDLNTIRREITSAYINNYSIININGAKGKNKEIRDILNKFVALEVSHQDDNKVTVKDLLNLREISVKGTVKRMDMIIRSLLDDCGVDDESISLRDQDLNRQYFLMFRILKGSLENKSLANFFEVNNNEIMINWYLAMNLESIGNCVSEISKSNELVNDVKKIYIDAMNCYYKDDKKKAHDITSQRNELIEQIRKENDFEISSNLREIVNRICDIARIVIDLK